MSEQLDATTWGGLILAILGTASGWVARMWDRSSKQAEAREAREDAAAADREAHMRRMVDELTAELRALLAQAQRDAAEARSESAEARAEASALRERMRALEDHARRLDGRVRELEAENTELRRKATA